MSGEYIQRNVRIPKRDFAYLVDKVACTKFGLNGASVALPMALYKYFYDYDYDLWIDK